MQMNCWVLPWGPGSLVFCHALVKWLFCFFWLHWTACSPLLGQMSGCFMFEGRGVCHSLLQVLKCTGMQRLKILLSFSDTPAMFGMKTVSCLLFFSYWLLLDLAGSRWSTTSLIGHMQCSPHIPPGSLTTSKQHLDSWHKQYKQWPDVTTKTLMWPQQLSMC